MAGLTIEALEAELKLAELELAQATAERNRAQQAENGWMTEVNSLRELVEVRKKRVAAVAATTIAKDDSDDLDDYEETNSITVEDDLADYGITEDAKDDSNLSHVNWIVKRLKERRGLTPPEIFRLAADEGRSMHRNYPYTALRALVNAKRVERRGERYYATSIQP